MKPTGPSHTRPVSRKHLSGSRRVFLRSGIAAIGTGVVARSAGADIAQARLVTGAAGSLVDVMCRRLAEAMKGSYARTVLVENRPGAAFQIAVSAVRNAAPDGATILVAPLTCMYLYPHTYAKLPYDPETDFAAAGTAGVFELAFAVGPAVPAEVKDLRQFFAWCKQHPQQASFGSPARGSTLHFAGAMAGRASGVDLQQVSYKGAPAAITDLMGGQIPAACATLTDFLPFLNSPKVRLLATSGASRSRFAPMVPTFLEQGFARIVSRDRFGIYLPAKAAQGTVDRLVATLREVLASPGLSRAFEEMALEPGWLEPAQARTLVHQESRRWGAIVKELGFTAET